MAELKVETKFILCGSPPAPTLFITINGRQALKEGPRRRGHCIYCAGPCTMSTTQCSVRVFHESWERKR